MSQAILTMSLLEGKFGVCRLNKDELIPEWAQNSDFFSITKTSDELSVVCLEACIPGSVEYEKSWKILKIEGPLDFTLVGILASISSLLAKQNISIFAISTYDTDYILVQEMDLDHSINSLSAAGYEIML